MHSLDQSGVGLSPQRVYFWIVGGSGDVSSSSTVYDLDPEAEAQNQPGMFDEDLVACSCFFLRLWFIISTRHVNFTFTKQYKLQFANMQDPRGATVNEGNYFFQFPAGKKQVLTCCSVRAPDTEGVNLHFLQIPSHLKNS